MKKNLYFSLGLFAIIILCFNCKTKNVNQIETNKEVTKRKNILKEIPSPDKSKILVLEYEDKLEIPIEFKYKVLDSTSEKQLISGVFTGIKIVWADNQSLKAYSYEAIAELDNPNPKKLFEIIKIE
ncbi:MAG: hypothetical protein WAO74_10325 [Polaribacter sp.]|uniref:hypothetical protein n=1 Tax=Polaribacter sp. TaxID=1920175 RepID=UPI003BB1439C